MAMRGLGPQSKIRAFGLLRLPGLPNPDLVDHLPIQSSSSSHADAPAAGQQTLAAGSLYSSWRVRMAQTMHAILLANAMGTSMRGFRASMWLSHDPERPPSRPRLWAVDQAKPCAVARGRALWREQLKMDAPFVHWNNQTSIAGLTQRGLIAPLFTREQFQAVKLNAQVGRKRLLSFATGTPAHIK